MQLPHVTFAFPNSHCWSLQQIDEPHLQIDSQPRDANPQRSKRIEQKSVKDLGIEDSFKLLHERFSEAAQRGRGCLLLFASKYSKYIYTEVALVSKCKARTCAAPCTSCSWRLTAAAFRVSSERLTLGGDHPLPAAIVPHGHFEQHNKFFHSLHHPASSCSWRTFRNFKTSSQQDS